MRRATNNLVNALLLANHFYPRSPCGERPCQAAVRVNLNDISIHALLAESDAPWFAWLASYVNFYPRSPCGERRWPGIAAWPSAYFYPRSPCGERRAATAAYSETQRFLSTLSLRRATAGKDPQDLIAKISIHALLAESDFGCPPWNDEYEISIHALLAESDGPAARRAAPGADFYPRSPCGERPTRYCPWCMCP